MSLKTIELDSVKITFDKEKTKNHRTEYNRPCDCQDCRNFYKNIENNPELVKFLAGFGVDYQHSEEVFSWELGNEVDSLIHAEGHYSVAGQIEGEGVSLEKYGVEISLNKGIGVPHDRTGDYFWIVVTGDFPYVLEEKRDMPITFSQAVAKLNLFQKIKAIFKKK